MKARISLINGHQYILNEDDTIRFKQHTQTADGLNKHEAFEINQPGDNPVCVILNTISTYEFMNNGST